MAGLSRTALRKISKEAFVDNLYNIARAKGYDERKLKEIAKLAKQHLEKRFVEYFTLALKKNFSQRLLQHGTLC